MKGMVLIMLLSMVLISGCVNTGSEPNNEVIDNQEQGMSIAGISTDVEKVEVFHFHGHNQCYSCLTIGEYSEEAVNTYFEDELDSGKLIFGHINAELPENFELAKKYEVTGSSLWIGVYREDGSFSKEQNTQVWYKISDKEGFIDYLKGVIKNKLGGN